MTTPIMCSATCSNYGHPCTVRASGEVDGRPVCFHHGGPSVRGTFKIRATPRRVRESIQAELGRLREVLDDIASPLAIDGENHMAAVKHARAALVRPT